MYLKHVKKKRKKSNLTNFKINLLKPQQAGQLTSSTPSTLNASLAKKPATPVTLTSLQVLFIHKCIGILKLV